MLIEVHTQEKPAKPARAWLAAAGLLLVAGALAADMTRRRSADPLGARIEPPGWTVSFRTPNVSEPGTVVQTVLGPVYQFRHPTQPGRFTMTVQRLTPEASGTPLDVCFQVLRSRGAGPASLFDVQGPLPAILTKDLGPLAGAEVHDLRSGTIVRAGVGNDGEGYAVTLNTRNASISPRLYRLFDRTCASVQHQTD